MWTGWRGRWPGDTMHSVPDPASGQTDSNSLFSRLGAWAGYYACSARRIEVHPTMPAAGHSVRCRTGCRRPITFFEFVAPLFIAARPAWTVLATHRIRLTPGQRVCLVLYRSSRVLKGQETLLVLRTTARGPLRRGHGSLSLFIGPARL
jgi:hypothetical protein